MRGDFSIQDWLIQPQINTVEKGGRRWHLEPKVMQVLVHLASHPNEVLSKERLIEAIWRDTFVGDDVLIRCISEIRYVFGDDPRSPSVIQTIPKAGYRLIASVSRETDLAVELVDRVATISQSNGSHPHERDLTQLAVAVRDEPTATPSESQISAALQEQIPPLTLVESSNWVNQQASREEVSNAVAKNSAKEMETGLLRVEKSPWLRRIPWVLLGIFSAVLVIWGGGFIWKMTHPAPFTVFWAPVLETPDPALFCIADQNQYTFIALRDAADPTRQVVLKDNLSAVVIDDLDTIVRVAGTLRGHGKKYLLKGEGTTTLSDLRNGPSIFVGAFDNAWTLRLTKSLRYHFANDAGMTVFQIVDSASSTGRSWSVDRSQQLATNNYKDFGIVARFTDSNTGKPSMVIAGIGRGGTIAAGEFLTDPDHLKQLNRAIEEAGNKTNLEIVLSTQIIDGQPGTPKIEASYFW